MLYGTDSKNRRCEGVRRFLQAPCLYVEWLGRRHKGMLTRVVTCWLRADQAQSWTCRLLSPIEIQHSMWRRQRSRSMKKSCRIYAKPKMNRMLNSQHDLQRVDLHACNHLPWYVNPPEDFCASTESAFDMIKWLRNRLFSQERASTHFYH